MQWLAYGAVIGPVALAILAAAPPGRCTVCSTPVEGWGRRCLRCGADVTGAVPSSKIATRLAAMHARLTEPGSSGGSTASSQPDAASPADVPAAPPTGDPNESRILATAVYAGGSAPLETGERYILSAHDESLQIRGPVEKSPDTVVFSRPLIELDVTGIDGRFIVTSAPGHGRTTMVFTSLTGRRPEQLEALLRAMAPLAPPTPPTGTSVDDGIVSWSSRPDLAAPLESPSLASPSPHADRPRRIVTVSSVPVDGTEHGASQNGRVAKGKTNGTSAPSIPSSTTRKPPRAEPPPDPGEPKPAPPKRPPRKTSSTTKTARGSKPPPA